MSISDLPAVNATLNGASLVLLVLGFVFIRQGKRIAHRNCMIGAVVTSTVFLICYLTYHFHTQAVTRFHNPPWFRPIYLVILITHTILATAVVPLVLMTLWRAWKQDFDGHRRLARWTWPVWLYVSLTGVVIYLLLYQVFQQ
ncbi:MAG: DUF420 domain-containing protein [Limisphaerales bacterium]